MTNLCVFIFILDTGLGNKFYEEGVISKTFKTAHSLLLTTNSGSKLLFNLLMIKHPKLALLSLATMDIPKHLLSNKLILYKKAIKNYLFIQSINKQTYSHNDAAYVYLSHLESDEYMTINDAIRAVIESKVRATLSLKYVVPCIAITISQLYTQQHNPGNISCINTTM